MELKICHLYPDVLGLTGDRGNLMCLVKRLQWRGIEVSVTGVKVGETLHAADFDLFFLGGGEDFDHAVLAEDLAGGKAAEIRSAVEAGKTFLAICGGYQILGKDCKILSGETYEFTGALDVHTEMRKERLIGNVLFSCQEAGEVVGFENHGGYTTLGEGVKSLGTMLCGKGNNGADGTEGARYKNVFASYSHGSLLPKNPKLADLILETALQHKYGDVQLPDLDDKLETAAHAYMTARLQK